MIQLAFPAGVIFGVTYQHAFMGWLAYVYFNAYVVMLVTRYASVEIVKVS